MPGFDSTAPWEGYRKIAAEPAGVRWECSTACDRKHCVSFGGPEEWPDAYRWGAPYRRIRYKTTGKVEFSRHHWVPASKQYRGTEAPDGSG